MAPAPNATTLIKQDSMEVLVEERKKEAIEKIIPKILSVTTTLGSRTTTGYRFTSEGAVFDYNELTGVILVSIGPNDQFAANAETNKCTVYRKGSWTRILDSAVKKIETLDVSDTKHKVLTRFKDVFGL